MSVRIDKVLTKYTFRNLPTSSENELANKQPKRVKPKYMKLGDDIAKSNPTKKQT